MYSSCVCGVGGEAGDTAEADAERSQCLPAAADHPGDPGALLHRPGHPVPQEQAGPGAPQLREGPPAQVQPGKHLSTQPCVHVRRSHHSDTAWASLSKAGDTAVACIGCSTGAKEVLGVGTDDFSDGKTQLAHCRPLAVCAAVRDILTLHY